MPVVDTCHLILCIRQGKDYLKTCAVIVVGLDRAVMLFGYCFGEREPDTVLTFGSFRESLEKVFQYLAADTGTVIFYQEHDILFAFVIYFELDLGPGISQAVTEYVLEHPEDIVLISVDIAVFRFKGSDELFAVMEESASDLIDDYIREFHDIKDLFLDSIASVLTHIHLGYREKVLYEV